MSPRTEAAGVFAVSKGGRWHLHRMPVGTPFKNIAGDATYVVHHCGALVRTDKDRRSPKERKRARREARAQKAAAEKQ